MSFLEADFEKIGGFSLDYYNWGNEDEDIIWKFLSRNDVVYLSETYPQLSVLHLEHPRTYNNQNLAINTQTYEARKKRGVDSIILEDGKKYEKL